MYIDEKLISEAKYSTVSITKGGRFYTCLYLWLCFAVFFLLFE